MEKYNPTRSEKVAALRHVRYEIESLLQRPDHDINNLALVESVEFRRMAHARALYEFFQDSIQERHQDNILAEDYEFAHVPHFYSADPADERKMIDRFNKDLFHLTYSRLRHPTPADKQWPTESLLSKIEQRSKDFIRHIVNLVWSDIPEDERAKWGKLDRAEIQSIPLVQNTGNIADPLSQLISINARRQ